MEMAALKTLKVSDGNHNRLKKVGEWGEPMDSIIGRLLDHWEGNKKSKK